MNNGSIENKRSSNRITEFPICQFYIVLGNHDREFKNNKRNKFFPIRGNEDIKLIQYAVSAEYKKKKKEGYAVAGEIIFLIPDVKYKDLAFKLMEILNFKGRVKIVPPLKKEEPPVKEETKPNPIKEEVIKKEEPPVKEEPKQEIKVTPKEEPLPKEKKEENNKKEIKAPKKEEKKLEETDITTYMWGNEPLESKQLKKASRKKKKEPKKITFEKPKKPKKKIDVPVIIFILSALLLIGSIILLFIWK